MVEQDDVSFFHTVPSRLPSLTTLSSPQNTHNNTKHTCKFQTTTDLIHFVDRFINDRIISFYYCQAFGFSYDITPTSPHYMSTSCASRRPHTRGSSPINGGCGACCSRTTRRTPLCSVARWRSALRRPGPARALAISPPSAPPPASSARHLVLLWPQPLHSALPWALVHAGLPLRPRLSRPARTCSALSPPTSFRALPTRAGRWWNALSSSRSARGASRSRSCRTPRRAHSTRMECELSSTWTRRGHSAATWPSPATVCSSSRSSRRSRRSRRFSPSHWTAICISGLCARWWLQNNSRLPHFS